MPTKRNVKKTAKRPKTTKSPSICFVIMPFGTPFDRYYENIYAAAVVDAELEPRRADSLFRSSNIVADIWRFTKESPVILADLSGKNPNVFYELGLAHALGKPVVLTASSVDDVPFDLRALRVLIYDREDEAWGEKLREGVTTALSQTLADIPSAVPSPFLEASRPVRPAEEPMELEIRRVWDELRALRSQVAGMLPPPRPEPSLAYTEEAMALVSYIKRQAIRDKKREAASWATDEVLAAGVTMLLAGHYIQAIKLAREVTGIGLKEAKDLIDLWRVWLERRGDLPGRA